MATQIVYIGDDFDIAFTALLVDGSVLDLTGATLYCDVQPAAGGGTKIAAAAFVIDAPAAGRARARFSSVQSAAFTAGAYYDYDGRVTLANGERHTIGSGQFMAKSAVTPTP